MSNVIFTKNAIRKIYEENLSRKIIYDTIQKPDRRYPGQEPGIVHFKAEKEYGLVSVVTKDLGHGEWLVISCNLRNAPGKYTKQLKGSKKTSLLERFVLKILKLLKK